MFVLLMICGLGDMIFISSEGINIFQGCVEKYITPAEIKNISAGLLASLDGFL